MMAWMMILALTISSSIDNFGVGISYGIRGIRINAFSNFIISVICFLFSAAGIYFGVWLSKVLPEIFPVIVGSLLLVIIGIRIMLLAMPRKNKEVASIREVEGETSNKDGVSGSLKTIMKDPTKADIDKSGSIGFVESLFLGVALSANALTNGLGAGLLGLSPIAICLAASIASFITVWAGVVLGEKVANVRIGKFTIGQFGTLISGVLLVIIAFTAFLD
ncbi:sporulation membrane protein YtaF [Bacillus paramycoides]|uniref:sporulation membrane protein YtaF n=1 Tax=Bacillus paramycoides TaxID=2026194 RepID=UPI002E1D77E4|nr:sporulation membrane protein YtaF [Bacillus paramycoides]